MQSDENEEAKKNGDNGSKAKTTTSKMKLSTVLADAFVPLAMQGTLADPIPDAVIPTSSKVADLTLAIRKIRQCTCPHLPMVPLQNRKHGPIAVPLRVPGNDELHFSLRYRISQLTNKSASDGFLVAEIRQDMDMQSYCNAFELLLEAERKELLLRYERYTQYNQFISPNRGAREVGLRMKGIAGARPAIDVGDSVVLRTSKAVKLNPSWRLGHYGVVDLHLQCLSIMKSASEKGDLLYIGWDNNKPMTSNFHVRIVPRPDYYLRCLTALSWLAVVPEAFFQKLWFPTEAPFLSPLSENITLPFLVGLNTEQLSFARTIIQRTLQPEYNFARPPVVLTGPAGTGKTKTLLSTIQQVLATPSSQRIRILVVTSSHTAADVVTRRLAKFHSNTQVFRLYNADRPVATVPVQILPFTFQDSGTGHFTLPDLEQLFGFDIIVCTCYDAHILYQCGLTNHQLRLRRMEIYQRAAAEFKACGATIIPNNSVNEPHFTHLFVDEAAQATEPETLIPLSVVLDPIPSSRKVEIALVGDPRQLSPQVYSARAAKAGLAQSWMERLLRRPVKCLGGGDEAMLGPDMSSLDALLQYSFAKDGHEQISFFLKNSYRGHPSFLAMPSALFYADKLQWASFDRANRNEGLANKWCEHLRCLEGQSSPVIPETFECHKQFAFPIHFRGVVGEDKSHTVTSGTISEESWTNEKEVRVVLDIVKSLITVSSVGSASIGVMAPFRSQVFLIRSLLRNEGFSGVNVGTIEDFQGIEMEVVILSLTRSTTGFLSHDIDRRIGAFGQRKQANVALTRAEQLQVVVGNPNGETNLVAVVLFDVFAIECRLINFVCYCSHGSGSVLETVDVVLLAQRALVWRRRSDTVHVRGFEASSNLAHTYQGRRVK